MVFPSYPFPNQALNSQPLTLNLPLPLNLLVKAL